MSTPMVQTSDLNELKQMEDVVESLKQRELAVPQVEPVIEEPSPLILPDHKINMSSRKFKLPRTMYSTVCNADFAPLVCNEFC